MNSGRTVFSQLMDFLSLTAFRRCVKRYGGDYKVRSFSCLDQFLTMAFAQLTYRESLRDIETCLRAAQDRLYHMGLRGKVSRSTLADANELRDWQIYADFAQSLIRQARRLYSQQELGIDLKQAAYVLDSSTIDLCLSLFPWAPFRKHKAAVKLHTVLDLRGRIPAVIRITGGLFADSRLLDSLCFEPAAFYVMDRAYMDLAALYRIHQASAFFVTRALDKFRFRRQLSQPVDKSTGVQCDQLVLPKNSVPARRYPEPIRRIRYRDAKTNKRFVFLTNHRLLAAHSVAELYRLRWQVELFFKWIKQHLRIKAFYGTTPNAVKTQVWIAISVRVLVAIVRKELDLTLSLHEILQILSISLFEKTPLEALLRAFQAGKCTTPEGALRKQLPLFNL
jgi:hypothetical protein